MEPDERPQLPGDELTEGWVDERLRAEFPKLALYSATVRARPGRSPAGVRRRLRDLSSRFSGPGALQMRRAPVPHAYRAFFHQIGLDPDVHRTPAEAAALDRLVRGGFRSRSRVADAELLAVAETGVPVRVLDADRLTGALGLRPGAEGETLGDEDPPRPVPGGRLVVADAERPVAVLFGDLAAGVGVERRTVRMTAFCVVVAGVPAIHAEEAMALALDVLTSP